MTKGISREAGAAAYIAESLKQRKCEVIAKDYIFVPFAVETLRPWSSGVKQFYKELSTRLIAADGDQTRLIPLSKVNIPTVKLNNGLNMPVIGYGTWMGLNDKGKFINEDVPKMKTALSYAIDIGYRHIDTAHLYRVEPEVGEIINKKIQEKVVKREELFVVTKVWNTFHKEKDVEASVRASLKRLNLDYLDSVLMHWPISFKETGEDEHIDYLETWRGLENVFKAGLVKSIGVSNFNVEQLKRLLANAHVVPVCNQVEINFNLGQNELVDYCKSKNIVVVAYSPFGTMVPSRSVPDSPEPKLNNPTLVAIAKKHNKTPTQIALKYLVQRGIVAIPKTVTNARVLENASIFDFTLDQGDVQTLAKFDNGFRTVRPVFWQNHQNYPFDKVALDKVPEIPEALRVWKNGALANID